MRFYEFTGEGVALNSSIVVAAKRNDVATRIARKWAEENGLNPDTLEMVSVSKVGLPAVVYGWNGGY